MMNKWWWIALLWSAGAQAVHPDFLQLYLIGKEAGNIAYAERSDWVECSETPSVEQWCSEPFAYYATPVWAEVQFDGEHERFMRLHADYSANHWSQMQLGLRKDGFQLQRAQLAQATFDVTQRLQTQSWQETDKALVLFLNQHARIFPKTLRWQHQGVEASLTSDGQDISLTFTRMVSAP